MLTVPPKFTAYRRVRAQLFHSVASCISEIRQPRQRHVRTDRHRAYRPQPAARRGQWRRSSEARPRVAFGNTLSGVVMCLSAASQPALDGTRHVGLPPDLPHGAGLIMLSRAYYSFFIDRHVCNELCRVRMARAMGMEQAAQPGDFVARRSPACRRASGVADLAEDVRLPASPPESSGGRSSTFNTGYSTQCPDCSNQTGTG